MSTVPSGVNIIKFRDREMHGWYGIVLAAKDDNAKVFRATPYDLLVLPRAEFTVMTDNSVSNAAKLWAESVRGATAPPQIRKTLELLAKLDDRAAEPETQHA